MNRIGYWRLARKTHQHCSVDFELNTPSLHTALQLKIEIISGLREQC
jgi:hypothetical protein